MCESTVVLKTQEGERELMTEVVQLKVSGTIITMSNLLGDRKTVKGTVESVDLLGHKLYIVSA